jgi:hypothetical protein
MGISISVSCETAQEWNALESEGFYSADMGYSSWANVLECFNLTVEDQVVGSLPAEAFLDSGVDPLAQAGRYESTWVVGGGWQNVTARRVADVIRVATVARQLRREVVWA